jgi:CPA1 family monovalent cation:H+ antiporter
LIRYGLAFSGFLIVLRLIWMFPRAYIANVIRRRILHQNERMPAARQVFVSGLTGMRGVISLAAAIALPQTLANGSPFAQRNMIIFLAFSVILVTLVLQGLTLPPLIRALGLAGAVQSSAEEKEARRAILQAPISYLEDVRTNRGSEFAEVYDDLAQHYRHRLATLEERGSTAAHGISADFCNRFVDASRDLLRVERETAVGLRNQRPISDELLRELEHELDLIEIAIERV